MLSPIEFATLSASLLPGSDMRQHARAAPALAWSQIFAILPAEVAALRLAATTETTTSLKLRVETIAANMQVPQAALFATDLGNARSIIINHRRATEWSPHYIHQSSSLRLEQFAWHYFTLNHDQLGYDWGIAAEKISAMKDILID